MCGCGGGSRNIRPGRAIAPRNVTPARIINQASINRKATPIISVTPKTTNSDKKRVEKLRKDAIRKTFGK